MLWFPFCDLIFNECSAVFSYLAGLCHDLKTLFDRMKSQRFRYTLLKLHFVLTVLRKGWKAQKNVMQKL